LLHGLAGDEVKGRAFTLIHTRGFDLCRDTFQAQYLGFRKILC